MPRGRAHTDGVHYVWRVEIRTGTVTKKWQNPFESCIWNKQSLLWNCASHCSSLLNKQSELSSNPLMQNNWQGKAEFAQTAKRDFIFSQDFLYPCQIPERFFLSPAFHHIYQAPVQQFYAGKLIEPWKKYSTTFLEAQNHDSCVCQRGAEWHEKYTSCRCLCNAASFRARCHWSYIWH